LAVVLLTAVRTATATLEIFADLLGRHEVLHALQKGFAFR
jgi:hypothetical protein